MARQKKVKPFRLRRTGVGIRPNLPTRPSLSEPNEEQLTGEVNGMQASAPEERMAKALTKANKSFLFRYVVGAPKGLPGWKEIDFLVTSGAMLYAVEVDTAFTHRNKGQKDKLHDAIILADKNLQSMGQLYPSVLHADGDSDLANDDNAKAYVRQKFGR